MIESELALAQDRGQCVEHPDRPAEGTCERCGRFVCGECVNAGAGQRCAACMGQMMAAVPSSAFDARWAVRLLYASGVLSASIVLLLVEVARPLVAGLGMIELPLFIATGVFFLRWLHRAVRLVQVLAADVSATPGWAVGYWFVPIINLYRPYQIVGRLAAAVDARLPSSLLGWWWASWVVSNLLGRAGPRTFPSLVLPVVTSLVSAAAAFLCAGVVSGIERALVARRQAFAQFHLPESLRAWPAVRPGRTA